MNYLILVDHGSGAQFMQCSILRDFAREHKDDKVYVSASNKYFADLLAMEVDNVESIDRMEITPLFNQIMTEKDEWQVLQPDVYKTYKFMTRQDNYYDTYRELLGMKRLNDWSEKGSKYTPSLTIPRNFEEEAEKFSKEHPNFVLFQRSGGINPITPPQERQQILLQGEKGLKRAYPVKESEQLVKGLTDRGYEVLQYCLPEEVHIQGATAIQQEQNQLMYAALVKYAKGVVCIDSSLMHLSIKNAKHITVIWGQSQSGFNDVRGFGYEKADNLFAENYKPISPYFTGVPDSPVVHFVKPEKVLASVDAWEKKDLKDKKYEHLKSRERDDNIVDAEVVKVEDQTNQDQKEEVKQDQKVEETKDQA